MDAGAWITLVAVVVALAIGVASIVQTKKIQKSERRQRLLNEIIEWALDISKCEPIALSSLPLFEEVNIIKGHKAFLFNLKTRYLVIWSRAKYINKIASTFTKELATAVGQLDEELRSHMKLIEQATDAMELFDKALEHGRTLNQSANNVVILATDIKTKNF